jgi:LsmAD domain/Ataxin 2 SM domain
MSKPAPKRTTKSKKWATAQPAFIQQLPEKAPEFLEQMQASEDLSRVIMFMMGHKVLVTLRNGWKYEGILDVRDPITGGTALKMARALTADKTTKPEYFAHLNILGKDIVSVKACGFRYSKLAAAVPREMKGFQTDTSISGQKGQIKERTLQRWDAPEDESSGGLEDLKFKGKWDQFATNEQLFGVKTDFDELKYTTKVDRSGADYKKREAEAERMAREIEKVFVIKARLLLVTDTWLRNAALSSRTMMVMKRLNTLRFIARIDTDHHKQIDQRPRSKRHIRANHLRLQEICLSPRKPWLSQ